MMIFRVRRFFYSFNYGLSCVSQGSFFVVLKKTPSACSPRTRATTSIGRDTAQPPVTLNTLRTRDPAETAADLSRVGVWYSSAWWSYPIIKSSFCHKRFISAPVPGWNVLEFCHRATSNPHVDFQTYLKLHSHPPGFQLPLWAISFGWSLANEPVCSQIETIPPPQQAAARVKNQDVARGLRFIDACTKKLW